MISFTPVSEFKGVAIDVAAGEEHSLLLTNDLKVFAVGNNLKGNLGLGHNFSSDTFL